MQRMMKSLAAVLSVSDYIGLVDGLGQESLVRLIGSCTGFSADNLLLFVTSFEGFNFEAAVQHDRKLKRLHRHLQMPISMAAPSCAQVG